MNQEAPERIWLQRSPDGSFDNRFIWSAGEVEYVRVDLYEGAQQLGRHAERKYCFQCIGKTREGCGADGNAALDRLVMDITSVPLKDSREISGNTRARISVAEQEVNSGEGLSDKELRMMEEWAGAKIADDNSDQDLYDMVVKTDHYLSAAVKEIRRLRTRARISVAEGEGEQ